MDGSVRHKKRSPEETEALARRLNKIEGQIRGVKKMLEEERYCVDILNQVASAQAALNGFGRELLQSHVRSCVVEDIQSGQEGAVDELCALLKKFSSFS